MTYKVPDEASLAYAAGFFDGEGSVIINRNNSNNQISMWIQASQRIDAPLDKLQSMFGGSVSFRSSGMYEWRMFGGKAAAVLSLLRPYLLVKGPHADIAIEFYMECHGNKDRNKKMEYYWKLQALQKKGQHLRKGENMVEDAVVAV